MSKYRLEAVLNESEGVPRSGALFGGEVRVYVDEDCECEDLRVTLRYDIIPAWADGGVHRYKDVEVSELFSGSWAAGSELSYPFEFTAPVSPRAYSGTEFCIVYEIVASADVKGAKPSRQQEVYAIEFEFPRQRGWKLTWDEDRYESRPGLPAVLGSSSLFLSTVAGNGWLFFLSEWTFSVLHIFGPVMALGTAVFAGHILPNWIAERKLGAVSATLSQQRAKGFRDDGGAETRLHCSVSVHPGSEVRSAAATLTVQERVEEPAKDSDDSSTTHAHSAYEYSVDLTPSDESGQYGGWLELPDPSIVIGTFSGERASMLWYVEVEVDGAGVPKWSDEFNVTAKAPSSSRSLP